jgi:hypothetical protein
MAAFQSSDDMNHDAMREFLGPHSVDASLRQAITSCWTMLPQDKRTVAEVDSQIRRLVDRALRDLAEDAEAFGIGSGS